MSPFHNVFSVRQAEKRLAACTDLPFRYLLSHSRKKTMRAFSRLECIGEQQALLATSPDA